MIRRFILGAALIAATVAAPAMARPVTDCPHRDAPFSASSPLIDLLLNPAARALVDRAMGGGLDKAPPSMFGTRPPTFAAILTLREATAMGGRTSPEAMAALDAELRRLPVTEADKVARCARYDNDVPAFDLPRGKRPRLLVFEKVNGFLHTDALPAANAAIRAMASRKGWAVAVTDRAGAFNPRTLRQFDAVIWNNVSGDVLTLSQRAAFKAWLKAGGAYVAVHGSGGDPSYFWDWYPDRLLGAQFIGHPMNPQFQEARIAVNTAHRLAGGLPAEWRMTDEWYSFGTNPRAIGADVVLTLDESTYSPNGMGRDLRMGADHPLAWTNCIGKGRMFYSAIGHLPASYAEPNHVRLLESAIEWAATDKRACSAGKARKR